MANNTWAEIETSEQFQRAGSTLKIFLKMLFDFNEAIRRSNAGLNEIGTLNHLVTTIGRNLSQLSPEAKQAFFQPGGKGKRFRDLERLITEVELYYTLQINKSFLDYLATAERPAEISDEEVTQMIKEVDSRAGY